MQISSTENQKTINKLKQGISRSYDLFIYGDKKAGIKPGNIYTYGAIRGQRQVLAERKQLQKQLLEEENEMQ